MAEQGAQKAMAVQGAPETMAVQGAPEAMAVQGAPEAMAVQGALEATAGGPCGRGLVPLGPATTAGTLLTPPQKKSMGQLRGYQEPSGAILRNRGPSQGKARKLRSLLGMTGTPQPSLGWNVESGALTGYAQQPLPYPRQERQTSLHGPDRQDKVN